MPDSNPRQNLTFASGDRQAHGYLAVPEAGSGPAVVVVQEWWGLDDHIVDVCDRFAREGFVALAPDLMGGRVAHDADEAGAMMQQLPVAQSAAALGGAVDVLLDHPAVTSGTVGVVGFCMGGGFALLMAAQQGERVSAVVPFYGVGPAVPDTYRDLTADVQGHYGEHDATYPVEQARAQEQQIDAESGGTVEFYYYDAGHAFHNDRDRLGTYDSGAAHLAWSRTVDFLRGRVH